MTAPEITNVKIIIGLAVEMTMRITVLMIGIPIRKRK